jgi:RimJ/RimL family protein N-acetyltransferase
MSLTNPSDESEPQRWQPLHTPRLTLREYDLADEEALFALESSEENARYQTWQPWTRAEASRRLGAAMSDSCVAPRAVVELAVVSKESGGGLVGRVGCRKSLVRGDGGDEDGGGEKKGVGAAKRVQVHLWFSLLPAVQGKGLATEAVAAFVAEMARAERNGKGLELQLEIECDPRNKGSRKLAERLGFVQCSLQEEAFECKGEMVGSVVYRKVV